jgi:hypothetical protein
VTQAPSLIGLFVTPLNRAGIEYMVTGGLAAVVYGHPRLTLDVDLVISLTPRGAFRRHGRAQRVGAGRRRAPSKGETELSVVRPRRPR